MTEPEFDDVTDPSKLFDHVPDTYTRSDDPGWIKKIERQEELKRMGIKEKNKKVKINEKQKEFDI